MTLLTIAQDAADLVGIPRPNQVFGSTDIGVRQLLALAQTEGRQLSRRYRWQGLMREATITTLAAEDQGALTTLAPGIRYLENHTAWDRSNTEPIGGPLEPGEWQALKAFTVTGPYNDFRIRDGQFLMIPAPGAGEDIRLEYLSSYWCQSSGGTDQSAWAADSDTGVLSEEVMTAGLRYRFLRAKGMDYAEEMREYEEMVAYEMSGDGGKRVAYADYSSYSEACWPTARAPIGSWNLP